METERIQAEHMRRMDLRIWVTQLATLVLCFANIVALAVVGWHFADTGNVIPGITAAATGTGLTTLGTFAATRNIGGRRHAPSRGKSANQSTQDDPGI
jgi:hypothetical protein